MATVRTLPVVSSSTLSVQSAFQPLFSPLPVHDNFYFDDGPRASNTKTAVTSSQAGAIDTTAIDPFAQGVEITRQSRYDAGLAKIWSGDPGHQLKPAVFGQDKNYFPGTTYADQDLFDPTLFLKSQAEDSPLWWNILTFPIVTSNSDELENFNFNGVIEPFPIREVVSFFSINVPFEAHTIRANLVGGNENQLNGSDRILTVDYFDPKHQSVGFLDMVDMIHNRPVTGFFRYEFSPVAPFVDQKLNRNSTPVDSYEDSILVECMDHMSGNTDNYVSYDQRSATCGWSYDNNAAIGTDSLVFGGMTY